MASLAKQRLSTLRAQQLSSIDDPVDYAERVLGIKQIPSAAEFMRAVAKHKQVSMVSGHKCSKSTSIACLALWWADTKPRGNVLLTATTNNQVRNIIWKEVRYLRNRAVANGHNLPEPALMPHIGMHWADDSEIIGLTAKDPEGFAGYSGANFLICVDEASGFPEPIFDAVFGNLAGGAHLCLTGNPTQPAGTHFDSHHRNREEWVRFQISSLDVVKEHGGSIPGLATKEWCDKRLKQWGPNDPRYMVRVLGKWPDYSENSVIPLHLVTRARERWADTQDDFSQVIVGCDPARFGDDESVITIRLGDRMHHQKVVRGQDGHQLGREIKQLANDYHKKGQQPPKAIVDVVGIGSSCYDWLNYNTDFQLVAHSGAERAGDEESYVNTRTEAWFMLREWLKKDGAIPDDDDLEADLLAPQYSFDNKNRYVLESKKDIKKRLGRSPDRGDSAALSVFVPMLPIVGGLSPTHHQPTPSQGNYRLGPQRGF